MSGNSAINPATGAAVSDKTEINLTLDFRFCSGSWHDWIRPRSLRARHARLFRTGRVDQHHQRLPVHRQLRAVAELLAPSW